MAKKSKLWTKDFIILSMVSFLITLIFFSLMTTTSLFVMNEYNASEKVAGLAVGIFVIGSLVSRLIVGKYLEMIGRRKFLYIGFVFLGIVTPMFLFIHDLTLFIFVRFIHGFAYGVAHTVISTAAMDIIPDDRRGEGTGYYALTFTLSTAIGPFLGILLIQQASMNMLLMFCAILSLFSFLISLLAKIPEAILTKQQLEEMKEFKLSNFIELKALPSSLIAGFMGFAYSACLSFLTGYAIDIDLTFAAGFFFIVVSIFSMVSRPLGGRILDIKGENTVVYPAILLLSFGYLILGLANNSFFLLLAAAVVGLSYGTIGSCCQAIGIRESPKHRVALANSTFLVFMNAGLGVGPFMNGFILPYLGYRGMFLFLAIMIFSVIFLYYHIHGKKHSKPKKFEASQASFKN